MRLTFFLGAILSLLVLPPLQAQDPNEPPTKEIVKVSQQEYFNRFANRFLTLGDFEKANHFVKKALELEPNNQESHIILTTILVKTEKLDEAKAESMIAFPNSKYDQLIFLADKCLEVEPASTLLRKQALVWALEAQTTNKNLNKWLGIILANAYFRNNDYEKAIEVAKSFIDREPKNSRFNILLGNIYTKKGEYEVAAKYLAKGMNREPIKAMCNNHISYQLLTYDDEAENRPIIALSYALLASEETQQKVADVEDTLGLAYFKTNDLVNAKATQERAVKLLRDELPPEQKERSTKLMGFKKQLIKYEDALKNSAKKND